MSEAPPVELPPVEPAPAIEVEKAGLLYEALVSCRRFIYRVLAGVSACVNSNTLLIHYNNIIYFYMYMYICTYMFSVIVF